MEPINEPPVQEPVNVEPSPPINEPPVQEPINVAPTPMEQPVESSVAPEEEPINMNMTEPTTETKPNDDIEILS